jgi:hypothetical protein
VGKGLRFHPHPEGWGLPTSSFAIILFKTWRPEIYIKSGNLGNVMRRFDLERCISELNRDIEASCRLAMEYPEVFSNV